MTLRRIHDARTNLEVPWIANEVERAPFPTKSGKKSRSHDEDTTIQRKATISKRRKEATTLRGMVNTRSTVTTSKGTTKEVTCKLPKTTVKEDGGSKKNEELEKENERNDPHDETIRETAMLTEREIELERQIAVLQEQLRVSTNSTPTVRENGIQLRDVEGTINKFDGGNPAFTVAQWITHMKECKEMYTWTDLQMLVCAKKSLTGLAKVWLEGQRTITKWDDLEAGLEAEFGSEMDGCDLHEAMQKRRKLPTESFKEYLLQMRALGSRGNLSDRAIIKYAIAGINDSETNKAMLYGRWTIEEFKKSLEDYQLMKERMSRTERRISPKRGEPATKHNKGKEEGISLKRCFNCGGRGHEARECKHLEKGTKCFRCNQFGHVSARCTQPKHGSSGFSSQVKMVREGLNDDGVTEEEPKVMLVHENEHCRVYKDVKLNGKIVTSQLDIGSDVHLINYDVYKEIGSPGMDQGPKSLCWMSDEDKMTTMGSLILETELDNELYELRFHVVRRKDIKAIIGNGLLRKASVCIKGSNACIKKLPNDELNVVHCVQIVEPPYAGAYSHLLGKNREKVRLLIENYKPENKKSTPIKMKLILKDDIPVYQSPRRLPLSEQRETEEQVDEWLEKGIIRPSCSDYASPVVVVRRKGGAPRVCVDYRALNKKIVRDHFPLPVIEEQLDKLTHARIFSVIDLKNAFHHVEVDEESRKFTAFVIATGQFEFNFTPFGLSNSPSVFQRYITYIFKDLIRKGIMLVYLDDIVIIAQNEDEAIRSLEHVLKEAASYSLDINWKKCQLLQKCIEYLGHVVQDGTIKPSPEKVKAVLNFPEPRNRKMVESFLGLAGYMRKFIEGFTWLAKALRDCAKEGIVFYFGEEQRKSFEMLKRALCTAPVLRIFDVRLETEVHTDASIDGYGAVLMQKCEEDQMMHPCLYLSKKTSDAERRYSSYELEVLAVSHALRKLRVYLLGIPFTIVTDCAAFKQTMDKKDIIPRIARWALQLQEFDYKIEHRSGIRMRHADALSRYPVVLQIRDALLERLRQAQGADEKTTAIKRVLETGIYEDYLIEGGLLYREREGTKLLVIPKGMQREIISQAHELGHFGLKKTQELINREYWIDGLKTKIESHIRNCVPCILGQKKRGKAEGFLHPIPKGETPLDTMHLDHVGPLPSTRKSYKHLLTMIDGFTKFVWIFPTKSTGTKEVLDKLRIHQQTFGNARRIITDRGTAFTSHEFQDYCKTENIEHHLITTGVPRGNGQIERIHRTLEETFTKLGIKEPMKWFKHVNRVQRALNSTFQRSIAASPFEVLIGTTMRNKEDVHLQELIEESLLNEFDTAREEIRKQAKKQITRVQEENYRSYNKKRKKASQYNVGDLVAIARTQQGPGLKVKIKFFGPYRIIKVKGRDRYNVKKISGEGPIETSSSADLMKPWTGLDENSSSGDDAGQDGRM